MALRSMPTGGLRSMTGFGAAICQVAGWDVSIETKSVNHRGLDARVHTARAFSFLERPTLDLVKTKFARGRLDVRIDVTFGQRNSSDISAQLASSAALVQQLSEEFNAPYTLADIIALRKVTDNGDPDFDVKDGDVVLDAVEIALDQLRESREIEGAKLAVEFEHLIATAFEHRASIAEIAGAQPDVIRSKLNRRFAETVKAYGLSEFDETRFAQELMFYVERCDVGEELQRTDSHLGKLKGLVRSNDKPAGKKIDFYLQEMTREVNTIGSKTNSSDVTDLVVELKSLVEKMREQAANVE